MKSRIERRILRCRRCEWTAIGTWLDMADHNDTKHPDLPSPQKTQQAQGK